MSTNIVALQTAQVRFPPTNINSERVYTVLKGAEFVAFRQGTTNSYSNANANFIIPPPSNNFIYDLRIWLRQPVTLTFTGLTNVSGSGTNLLIEGADGFRAFPLTTNMSNMQLQINNTTNNIVLKDFIQAALRYHTCADLLQTEYSMTPCALDCYQSYSQGFGSNRNPLGSFSDNCYIYGRGSFPYTSVVQTPSTSPTVATTSVVTATLVEPIFIPPCYFGKQNGPGIIGVSGFNLTINWGNLQNMWSHDAINGNNITNIAVTFGAPTVMIRQYTPQDLQLIPKAPIYPYYEILNTSTNANTPVAPGATFTTAGNNIQLQTIPNKVFIFAKKQDSARTFSDTDTFAAISSISVTFNGQSNFLADATQWDLYNLCKANGSNQSWEEFCGYTTTFSQTGAQNMIGTTGSVLCLKFGVDIGLKSSLAPSTSGSFNFQVNNITYTNTHPTDTITYELWYFFINEGTMTIYNNTSNTNIGVLTELDVLQSTSSPLINYDSVRSLYGGDFFGDIKTFGKNLFSGIERALPVVSSIVGQVAPIIAGLGMDDMGGCNAGALVGGKRMSRRNLKNRLI